MRRLAEDLCARGVSVLRFDYRGTGDSVGEDGAAQQLQSAVADICAAVAWLKQETGVTELTLCGLRLGASFAALAARKCSVNALVMLAPVADGRSYLRELSILRETWLERLSAPVRAAQPTGGPFNVLGQIYSDEFRKQLSALELRKASVGDSARVAPRTLLFETHRGASEMLRASLVDRGAEVDCHAFPGYFRFMQESALSVLPERVFSTVVNWITDGDVVAGINRRAPQDTPWKTGIAIETPDAVERAIVYGAPGLFGVLCEPLRRRARNCALLITNTSASAHTGDSRLSVRIAREMAQRGIASLRIDARGMGDSAPLPALDRQQDPCAAIHSETTVEDVAAAAAWLKKQGFDSVVSFGICSGGYSALRAALVEPAIAGVLTVNLNRFYVPDGFTLDTAPEKVNSMAGYRSSMLERSKWLRIIRGERSVAPIARAIVAQAVALVRSQIVELVGLPGGFAQRTGTLTDPRSIVKALERKGVRTLLVYGAFDSGLDQLTTHFGKRGKRLSRFSMVSAAIFEELDHALFNPRATAKVIALCEALIRELSSPGVADVEANVLGTLPTRGMYESIPEGERSASNLCVGAFSDRERHSSSRGTR